jgi:hypothetical protein
MRYTIYICTYVNIWGEEEGEGEGDEWQYIRCKIFRFSEHTKATSASKVPPPTHTNQDWNLYRNQIFSTLGWRGSTLLELL